MFVVFIIVRVVFFVFKQKTAYEMRISDWSSDVCSSDLRAHRCSFPAGLRAVSSPRFHRAAPAPPAREQGSGRLPSPIPRASDCLLTLWMTAPSAAPRPVRVLSDDAAAPAPEPTAAASRYQIGRAHV